MDSNTSLEKQYTVDPPQSQSLVGIIVDDSSSMDGTEQHTVDGVNEYLNGLASQKASASISLAKFSSPDHDFTSLRFSTLAPTPIERMNRLTFINQHAFHNVGPWDYAARGSSTALYDAIAEMIQHLSAHAKPGQKVIVVTLTDGQENSSVKYGRFEGGLARLRNLIKQKEAEGWLFIFLGANLEATAGGQQFTNRGNTMTYQANMLRSTMSDLSASTMNYMQSKDLGSADFFSDYGPSKKGKK